MPAESAACGTDSPAPGTWQAGVEEALDFVQAAQEGSELLPSIGLVNVYTLFYPEHLILGDDIYHRARYAVMDIDFDDESLALDAIAEVGPGGHFLGNRHTRRHMREAVKPAITHQAGPDGAYRDPLEVARERAEALWRDYRPEPLEDGQGRRAREDPRGGRRRAARLVRGSRSRPYDRMRSHRAACGKLLTTTEERSTMDENGNAPQAGAEGAEVRHGLIGMVRAGDAHVRQSASVLTTAKGGADLDQSASMALVSGGDTSMKMSAAVAVPTLGDLHIEKGGAQWAVAAGDVSFEKGGCAVAVAPSVRVDRGGVGVALGWHVDVGENSRVHLRAAGGGGARPRLRRRHGPRHGRERRVRGQPGLEAHAAGCPGGHDRRASLRGDRRAGRAGGLPLGRLRAAPDLRPRLRARRVARGGQRLRRHGRRRRRTSRR